MTEVIIMVGASGSGKTTYRRKNHPTAWVCSADEFPGLYNEDGSINFRKLGNAHAWCMRQFIHFLQVGASQVVVDNTNATAAQIAPYIAVADAYECKVRIVVVSSGTVSKLVERNVHNVPRHTIERQLQSIGKMLAEWPAFWPHPEII